MYVCVYIYLGIQTFISLAQLTEVVCYNYIYELLMLCI